jgi:hypothetical protein
MNKNRWIILSMLAIAPIGGLAALAQTQFPTPPTVPQIVPPTVASPADTLATTELRIALQKAQIQAALTERVAQAREENLKTLQAKASAGTVDQEALLDAQMDAVAARAAAESAKIDAASLDTQNRAGAAALQQAQNSSMPPQGGFIPPANPLIAQLMQMDYKKAQIQSSTAAQMVPLRQKLYDLVAAQQKAGTATSEKLTDAMLDLEAAKAAQRTAALDEQLLRARMTASGVK